MHLILSKKKHWKEMGEMRKGVKCVKGCICICMQAGGWMFPLH